MISSSRLVDFMGFPFSVCFLCEILMVDPMGLVA
ncbi:hypothetical protein SLEP1_g14400 [Rubroshorea leprosula]|uniref:Uncharacterized protein n=1 Tax=Rubroshorea leprosula TaxID=152421 RepID=A0AAV5IPX5_9ROSI|nr:hypothetical protein SLEP1_g14400 [Rubroshorea leprosula]